MAQASTDKRGAAAQGSMKPQNFYCGAIFYIKYLINSECNKSVLIQKTIIRLYTYSFILFFHQGPCFNKM